MNPQNHIRRRHFLKFLCVSSLGALLSMNADSSYSQPPQFSPQSTVGDVLDDPLFAGFSRYLLPLETLGNPHQMDADDRSMPLWQLDRLLPFHSHIDVGNACGVLNRMRARAQKKERIWVPLSSNDAGLFFFPGQKKAPFVLIAAGGGFVYVGSIHEGFPYAEAMNRHGFNAFVLQYRTSGGSRTAMIDMAEGLDYILRHADELGVSARCFALMGSSAGARMAAVLGAFGLSSFGFADQPKASAVLMAYTGYSDVSQNDPPTFMVQGTADGIAPVRIVDWRMQALKNLDIDVQYERIPGMPHGFGLGTGTAAAGWIDKAAEFFKRHQSLSDAKASQQIHPRRTL